MTSKFETGQILEGKVTGIQPYGAFVALDEDTQGLVHISEVTHGFVKDINEHLSIGDEVKVKVLNVDEEKNKVSLSIRATEEAPAKSASPKKHQPVKTEQENDTAGFNTLKDKLEEWIEQSKNDSFKK
ncbi:S1 domain-containing post-transcriptional regulator GSP13 [Virgibacillus halodenitrificans]|jgi:general stress protein 13|uniref:General stress protein 13 n=1 Tax=Virgibacillus halodenitrificans TaxID=1482 RepID=A0AAC9NLP4_VIRHA|nr:S1 domain-containing post-transcriptional regulator GSP13 [Virgibacillus halodenitrificans]APC48909.1 RNA-binding protein S1 [Virgibacillus halodenitrificans]MBD1223417.1 general stress protein 13 [Virgibacillus halodenitrificans]MCG1026995.1 general stress protein 13 [Virgibacillus halodenitrificans]MCJ0933301.1 S1 domain-containing post-transcriptional regulator GSP13 [Virgibacillus halodenitrificans]MEC2159042.1 S1 domain-containing post-transcriptional regulator GSP13 [Virgibacillus hal